MLEISVLIALARYTYRTAEEKGYPGAVFAAATVVSWFGGGIGGGIVGMASDETDFEGISLGFVFGYLIGVAIAGAANCMIVSSLPEGRPQPNPAYERRRQQELEDWEYIERRRRGDPSAGHRSARREEEEVVPLTQAPNGLPIARPVSGRPADSPRAQRAWRRRY